MFVDNKIIVKSQIAHCKLENRAPGEFFLVNSDNLRPHSVVLDTAIAMMSELLDNFFVILFQEGYQSTEEETKKMYLKKG